MDFALLEAGPEDIEAEMGVLGTIMFSNATYSDVQDLLRPEHFVGRWHGEIYRACGLLIDSGRKANWMTLREHMSLDADFDQKYLVELADAVVTTLNMREVASLVHECFVRRQLIQIGYSVVQQARAVSLDVPPARIIEQAEGELIGLAPDGPEGGFEPIGSIAAQTITNLKAAIDAGGQTGIPTGILKLDEITGGLHHGEPVWLGARPGVGKSGLLTSIAVNVALAGYKVAVFSLEERATMIASRMLSHKTSLGLQQLRLARGIGAGDLVKLDSARDEMADLQVHIDDSTGLTIPSILARCKKLRHEMGGLDLVLVDHLRLINPMDHRASPYERINEASEGLKMLCKVLNVALVAAVQLNRAVEGRDDKRPTLSDLRQSGQLEEDARTVMFLYREAYYLKEPRRETSQTEAQYQNKRDEWEADLRAIENDAELIIAKQNNGPLGVVKLHFDPNSTAFRGV